MGHYISYCSRIAKRPVGWAINFCLWSVLVEEIYFFIPKLLCRTQTRVNMSFFKQKLIFSALFIVICNERSRSNAIDFHLLGLKPNSLAFEKTWVLISMYFYEIFSSNYVMLKTIIFFVSAINKISNFSVV